MLWNLGVERATGKIQFHADRVVRFGPELLLALLCAGSVTAGAVLLDYRLG
jgi:hypothetical protein